MPKNAIGNRFSVLRYKTLSFLRTALLFLRKTMLSCFGLCCEAIFTTDVANDDRATDDRGYCE